MKKSTTPEERGWDRGIVNATVNQLVYQGFRVEPQLENMCAFQYRLVFRSENGTHVFVYVQIAEWQTDSNVVITNMVTLPERRRRNGHGGRVIEMIVKWAVRNDFNEIRATQINDPDAQRFWERNQFTRLPDPNQTGDYVRRFL